MEWSGVNVLGLRRLSRSDVLDLLELYETTDSSNIRKRCLIIGFANWGCQLAQIASLIPCGEDVVIYWIERYKAEGIAALKDPANRGGEEPPDSAA